jgi:hypothetical protein
VEESKVWAGGDEYVNRDAEKQAAKAVRRLKGTF